MVGSTAAAVTASPALLYTYAHPHNKKSHSNTEKQFSVFIYACCNLLFLVEVEINCLWVGFTNPDRLPLALALPWASNQTNQGHNYLSLKLRKLCFQSHYLRLHILALLSTTISSMTVPRNVATLATLIAHTCIYLGCTTFLSLPKHHWGITTNTSSLRCISWRFLN